MTDLDTLEAAIAEGEKKNFFVAPIVKELIAELRHAREENAALAQTSADLCVVCGWRFFVPGEGCQGCERARLEAEVDALRLQRVLDNEEAARLYDFARDKGQALERDAVVAWLRGLTSDWSARQLSDFIERGEHRREEER